MSMTTSLSLLERMKADDQVAWERFVKIYTPLVYAWCRKTGLSADDSNDVSSDVIRLVFEKIDKFDPGKFRAWLRTLTRNKVMDFYRKNQKHFNAIGGSKNKAAMDQIIAPDVEVLDDDEDSLTEDTTFLYIKVWELIRDGFPDHYWKVIEQYVINELPARKVAEENKISQDAVYQIKRRVLTRIRNELSGLL